MLSIQIKKRRGRDKILNFTPQINLFFDIIFSMQVHVVDVDDNPPVFTNKIFTGGISTDVSYGSVFMQVFVRNKVYLICIGDKTTSCNSIVINSNMKLDFIGSRR